MIDTLFLIYIIIWGLVYFSTIKREPGLTTVDSVIYAAVALLWPVMLVDWLLNYIFNLMKHRD